MATANKPGTGPAGPAKGSNKKAVFFVILAVLIVCGPAAIPLATMSDDVGTDVPPPTVTERNDTVPILRAAFEEQGICYGWLLDDGYGNDVPVSVGSNLGDGVPVQDSPQCPRWVQVFADVTYTSDSSEAEDYASVRVEGSSDFDTSDLILVKTGLSRFGLTDDAFVDDPGWAVTRAAVSLPLLVAERGAASPAPVGTEPPAAAPSPLPAAGSDLWRDRRGWLIGAAVLLLLTALLVTVGLVQRRRQRRAVIPGQRTGPVPAADRTRERA